MSDSTCQMSLSGTPAPNCGRGWRPLRGGTLGWHRRTRVVIIHCFDWVPVILALEVNPTLGGRPSLYTVVMVLVYVTNCTFFLRKHLFEGVL